MANKQILNREDSENESVLFDNEELLDFFSVYYLLHDVKNIQEDLLTAKEAHYAKYFEKNIRDGKSYTELKKDYKQSIKYVWQLYADNPEECTKILMEAPQSRAEVFIENRYPSLVSSFLNYLEPLVLAGMRSGVLISTWWRAVNYGFSVTPYPEEGEVTPTNAFPYLTVEEMTEEDRRAFRWTVEDTFFNIINLSVGFYSTATKAELTEKEYTALETGALPPYPEKGFTTEELIKRHSDNESTLTEDELCSWEYEMELSLPIAINRLDNALCYATKYSGTEYKDYIKSLNVEEDFDFNRGAGEYKKVMQEGYVWHWEE